MAVVENAATVDLGINDRTTFENISGHPHSNFSDDQNLHHHLYPHQSDDDINGAGSTVLVTHDQSSLYLKPCSHFHRPPTASMVQLQQSNVESEMPGFENQQLQQQRSSNGGRDFKVDSKEIDGLVDMFSNLNPLAAEFVPPSLSNPAHHFRPGYYMNYGDTNPQQNNGRQKKGNNVPGKRRMNNRTNQAQREYVIRRTVYVSDIDQQVTEEQLANLFVNCGQVVDCRICGDPNSVLRFAFVEFTDEEGALAALSLSGTMLGYYPVKVLPSKTAIAPVNPNYLPRSEDEREMCARTIYCTNIDKKVGQNELRLFFESVCGEVHRLRLLGDYQHSTRIAFVEFVMAESAIAALNCSGVVLGSLPIRVSPSKTPVRPRAPRQTGN